MRRFTRGDMRGFMDEGLWAFGEEEVVVVVVLSFEIWYMNMTLMQRSAARHVAEKTVLSVSVGASFFLGTESEAEVSASAHRFNSSALICVLNASRYTTVSNASIPSSSSRASCSKYIVTFRMSLNTRQSVFDVMLGCSTGHSCS